MFRVLLTAVFCLSMLAGCSTAPKPTKPCNCPKCSGCPSCVCKEDCDCTAYPGACGCAGCKARTVPSSGY